MAADYMPSRDRDNVSMESGTGKREREREKEKAIIFLAGEKKLDEVEKHEQLPPHPNCVRFYRAWEERLHLYIQTELCLMKLVTLLHK